MHMHALYALSNDILYFMNFPLSVLYVAIADQPFVPSGDSADEEETIDMEEESAAKVHI